MAMKFQYDEQGDSFVYFVLAFLLLILVPSTYVFWPRADNKGKKLSVQFGNLRFSHFSPIKF